MRRTSRVAVAALATVAFSTGAAQAATAPLNAYELKVKPTQLEDLAQAGYDVTEGRVGNRITVVATRAQARALAKQGFKPRKSGDAARVAPAYGPTGGYDVWRPYARPAYDLAGDEVPNLSEELKQLAADNPGFTKLVKIGQTNGGPDDPATTDDDDYVKPKPIWALKVSRDAKSEPDGSKPAVIYSSTQHAREWLSTETNRRLMRLFIDNYGQTGTAIGTDGNPVDGIDAEELTELVKTRELWFLLVANPNGYDYTFESPATRLWRKNLRDNNGDGRLTSLDGVDPNRNFPTNWGYDNEGSSSTISSETFRGTGPASEPETKAFDALMTRTNAEFNNNFHTFGQLLLYPFGWQVNTYAADDPLFRALSGSDENPAIPDFNPGVGAELYTTNGDTNDHAYQAYDILSWTPELKGGDPTVEPGAGGFIFQDVEADVQAEFEDQLPFSLDMARNAPDPSQGISHLGNVAPDYELESFKVSYGDPQTVQVKAKRSLGPVTVHWQVGQGTAQSAPTTEWLGGERYGGAGDVYYHRVRADISGAKPGQKVKVWFTANGGTSDFSKSQAFTYTLESDSDAPVLVLVGENYSGGSPGYSDPSKPKYLGTYTKALTDLGIAYDVWDVDARGLTAPDPLGVLSHYKAVIWYTGDDFITRYPGQPGGTGAAKVANDIVVAVRDHINEGGKLLLTGEQSGSQYFTGFEYSQFGEPVANTDSGYCDSIDSSVDDGCIPLSNDFFQYYLGGYIYAAGGGSDGDQAFPVKGLGDFGGLTWSFTPDTQTQAGTALVTSSLLPVAKFPQFASQGLAEYVRPGAAPYAPYAGEYYVFSGASDNSYRRLATTVDLTGKTGGKLDFQTSFDTESEYDFLFVEAHTPGQDDWTTLEVTDDAGDPVSSTDTGFSCGGDGYTWQDEHPFLAHYQTIIDPDTQCDPTGTTGEWNAVTGNSGGWQHFNVDLSAYDGQPVEISITYVQDPAVAGLGVFVDEARTRADGGDLSVDVLRGRPRRLDGRPARPRERSSTPPTGRVRRRRSTRLRSSARRTPCG